MLMGLLPDHIEIGSGPTILRGQSKCGKNLQYYEYYATMKCRNGTYLYLMAVPVPGITREKCVVRLMNKNAILNAKVRISMSHSS